MSRSDPPLVLAMDAATPPSRVAIVAGRTPVAELDGPFGPRTDAWILGAIHEAVSRAGVGLSDLAAIAATTGPGTFTGIRVGLATAMGLARGLGIRVAGIGTLEALAEAGRIARSDSRPLLAVIDARRGQIYAALIDADGVCARGPALVDRDEAGRWLASAPGAGIVGPGAAAAGLRPDLPDLSVAAGAGALAARLLGSGAALPPPVPRYVRPPDARPGTNPLRRRTARPESAHGTALSGDPE